MTSQDVASTGGRRVAGFVRHGHFERPDQTASAHSLFPLSALGRDQARQAVDPILDFCEEMGLELDARIEASQLLRAWETASLIAEALEKRTGRRFHVLQRDELIERGLGSCANMRFEQIVEMLGDDPRLAPLPEGWRRMPGVPPSGPGRRVADAGGCTCGHADRDQSRFDPSGGFEGRAATLRRAQRMPAACRRPARGTRRANGAGPFDGFRADGAGREDAQRRLGSRRRTVPQASVRGLSAGYALTSFASRRRAPFNSPVWPVAQPPAPTPPAERRRRRAAPSDVPAV